MWLVISYFEVILLGETRGQDKFEGKGRSWVKQIHEKKMLFALIRHSVKKEILLSRIFREINFSLNNLT